MKTINTIKSIRADAMQHFADLYLYWGGPCTLGVLLDSADEITWQMLHSPKDFCFYIVVFYHAILARLGKKYVFAPSPRS